MNFLKKVQNLPEEKKKIILWIVVGFFGVILFFYWIGTVEKSLSGFDKEKTMENVNFPEIGKEPLEEIKTQLEELKNLEQNEEGSK